MKPKFIYLSIWVVLNILTAILTELYPDEAYYWLYSKYLDWGYFDHPPFVALLIKLTSFLGQNELAVRLPFIFLLTATIWLVYELAKVNVHLYFLTVFSIFSLNTVGFLALPDTPFLFFGVLFLYTYKSYLEKETVQKIDFIRNMGGLYALQ